MFIRVKNVKFAFVPPSAESESSFFYRFNQNKLVYNKLQIHGVYLMASSFINNSSLDAAANDYWGATICDKRTDDGFCITKNVLVKYVGLKKRLVYPVA